MLRRVYFISLILIGVLFGLLACDDETQAVPDGTVHPRGASFGFEAEAQTEALAVAARSGALPGPLWLESSREPQVVIVADVGGTHVAALVEDLDDGFSGDWERQQYTLAIYDRASPDDTPVGTFDLTAEGIMPDPPLHDPITRNQLYFQNGTLYLDYTTGTGESRSCATFDLTDPTNPILLDAGSYFGLPFTRNVRRFGTTSVEAGEGGLRRGARGLRWYTGDSDNGSWLQTPSVDDLQDEYVYHLEADLGERLRGLGTFWTAGDHAYTSYFVGRDAKLRVWPHGDRVQYTLVDLDLSDADTWSVAGTLPIPGSFLGLTPDGTHVITVDYRRETFDEADEAACLVHNLYPVFHAVTGRCSRVTHHLKFSRREGDRVVEVLDIPLGERWIRDAQVTATHLFYTTYEAPLYDNPRYFPETAPAEGTPAPQLHVIPLVDNPAFTEAAVVDLPHPYAFLLRAVDAHALVVVDDPAMIRQYRVTAAGAVEVSGERLDGRPLFDAVPAADAWLLSLGTTGVAVLGYGE
ncbi:hypothetical protein KJ975_05115 [Myxococcota bacterium]|nr:hypothetical protein [Myxococcota bacterium]